MSLTGFHLPGFCSAHATCVKVARRSLNLEFFMGSRVQHGRAVSPIVNLTSIKLAMAPKRVKRSNPVARARKGAAAGSPALPPPRAPSVKVEDALRALRNNETKLTTEVKGLAGKLSTETKTTYPPELLNALRGMFPSTREYLFELHYATTQTSTAGGGLLGSETTNPSVTSFYEWTALAALFDEVNMSATSMSWISLLADSTAIPPATLVLAFDEQSLASSAPASYAAVTRIAGSREFNSTLCDSGSGRHFQRHKCASRAWCSTATPATQSPVGGMAGSWSFGNNGLFPVTTACATTTIRVAARFRCRA